MRKSKVWLSALLAVVIASAVAVPAFASPGSENNNKDKKKENVVNFVDRQATDETKSLFAYLNGIRGNSVIFGHEHATTEGISITAKDGTQSEVQNSVGDLPGMFGWDTLSLEGYEKPGVLGASQKQNRDKLIGVMKKAYKEGGVLALSAHMPNFVTGENFYDTKGNVVSHILPGGDKHADYNKFLDRVADFANNLKDDKGKAIPVIFRPFHEQNGSWFWWGAPYRTKEQYVEIYRYTVEYLRDKKKVHNFLYAYSPNSSFNGSEATYLETYPGDEYVDILGFDAYYDGTTETWFDSVVSDAKLISKIADKKGKVAAFTEFGYKGLKESGTNDLNFFTKLLKALKSDPDARRMAYMLTWANFSSDAIYVPYKNAPNGLGDHELLPDFVSYYKDKFTSFSDEVRAAKPYANKVKAAEELGFLHIATPTNNATVPTASPSTIRVRILSADKSKTVKFLINNGKTEYPMKLDADGFYYTANWTPGAALDETEIKLTVNAYSKHGKTLTQTITLFASDQQGGGDPYVVDTFDTYKGSNELLDGAYSPAGDLNTITLDGTHKSGGKYGLKFDYNVSGQGYTGETKNMNNVDWSEANKLKFWLEADGSDNKSVIQVNASGVSFEAYPSLAAKTAGWVEIPFSKFAPAPWDTANAGKVMTKENLKDIRAFSIYVNKKDATSPVSGTLYFDDIHVLNDGTGGVPDTDSGTGNSSGAKPGLLYGFETDTAGWVVEVNNASAAAAEVTKDAAAEGASSLQTAFALSGADFELVQVGNIDLSEVSTLTAKVKLSSGTAKARVYVKTGDSWSWSDSGMVDIGSDGFTTITLKLSGIADRNNTKAIGFKLEGFAGTGTSVLYVDDIRLSN
ncbi:glycosyl hydrolase [Paenibacillus sp. NEAU-GSW1]|uniref:glycosyl hydrolase n=1 Tax=Paenibacillus sp. NEAU-GSW1 TaxID=2682486 RepID=UPI0012E0D742|nr:glycosyl hydrolase [Paenibacillus sp. NEAU-GSW1]MUT67559.1 mannanase [Paenibacillus sp. NEAU-GSW1]